jgi:hypothetical protein
MIEKAERLRRLEHRQPLVDAVDDADDLAVAVVAAAVVGDDQRRVEAGRLERAGHVRGVMADGRDLRRRDRDAETRREAVGENRLREHERRCRHVGHEGVGGEDFQDVAEAVGPAVHVLRADAGFVQTVADRADGKLVRVLQPVVALFLERGNDPSVADDRRRRVVQKVRRFLKPLRRGPVQPPGKPYDQHVSRLRYPIAAGIAWRLAGFSRNTGGARFGSINCQRRYPAVCPTDGSRGRV